MAATQRPKLLLLIPHLGGGGAERVTALLAQGLSKEKYEIHLGLITQKDAHDSLDAPGVQVHGLGARRVRGGALPLLKLVRTLKPDLILSGMAHLNFLVLLLRPLFPKRTRVVVRQNSTVSAALSFGGLPWYTEMLYRLLYRRADRVICQTQAMAADLAGRFGIPDDRLPVLANPVDVQGIRARLSGGEGKEWSLPGPHLLVVGRLSREKGFDLLLLAISKVRKSFPDLELVIAGVGPEEKALKSQCAELGLGSAIRFAGHLEDPVACFAGATAFVLSSRHEGLPNALLEAAASGLPIVAVPSSAGVVRLLHRKAGVWLAEEVSAEALAESLLAALNVLRPGERFAHEFVQEFALESAIEAYEAVIDAVLFDSALAGSVSIGSGSSEARR
jgi:glycosyltransferase involved in cell wall biosynthesis